MQAFRQSLVLGDSDRDWTYVWSRAGALRTWAVGPNVGPWTVAGKPVATFCHGATNADLWWHQSFHGGFRLPDGTKPGPVAADCGGGVLNLIAMPAPKRKAVTVPAGSPVAAVRDAFAKGNRYVTLAAGEHAWDSPLDLAGYPWAALRGYGATVRVLSNGAAYNPAIYPGPFCSVHGVTFVSDVPSQVFGLPNMATPPGALGVVADVTCKRVNFGWGFDAGLLVRNTRFQWCGVNNAVPGMYLRCAFEGSPGQGWWGGGPRIGNTAVVQASFIRCDRGLVLTTKDGDIGDNLFVNFDYLGCTRPDGELFLVEGNGAGHAFDRNLIIGPHSTGCTGSLIQLDEIARGNLIWRPMQDECGGGIVLGSPWDDAQVPNKDVSGNAFEGMGAWKPRVVLGARAVGNTADGVPLASHEANGQPATPAE
jgi:hypothetical protein